MPIISKYNIVGMNTVQASKVFNSQPLAIQAEKGKVLPSMMPAIKKAIKKAFTENESLKKKNTFLRRRMVRGI